VRRGGVFLALIVTGCFGLPKQAVMPSAGDVSNVHDVRDELALAATCLENGNTQGAIDHLLSHVQQYPDHVSIRSLLADQYLKLGQTLEARVHIQRMVDDWQDDPARHREQLVMGHTRLMRIAQDEQDEVAESFHRGMGLLLVVEGWDADGDHDRVLTERTLSQALSNFRSALEHRPNDARVNLALGEVLSRLGQHSAARTAFRMAIAAPPGSFTTAERLKLAKFEE
jgi:Tfp pilus assembly protein PilF